MWIWRTPPAASHSRVVSGEIQQSALSVFGAEQLRGAEFKWPKGRFSVLENDDDGSHPIFLCASYNIT